MLALVGTSLTGCLQLGSDSAWMSQDQKQELREGAIKDVASKAMSCPAHNLQLVRNNSLIKDDNELYSNGYAYTTYDVYGCGTKKTFLVDCRSKRKFENVAFLSDTVVISTLGTINPEKLTCEAEQFSTDDIIDSQTRSNQLFQNQ